MRTGLLYAIALTSLSLAAAAVAETTPAVWKEKEFNFTYHGFTTSYSCDGLKYKVKVILAVLGARSNPRVRATGCEIGGGVASSPRVHVRAAFPESLPAGNGDAQVFAAQVDVVTLSPRGRRGLDTGDCELLEQLRHRVFPEIGSKVLADRTACVPHQQSPGRPYLQLQVLRPVSGADRTSLTN